MLTFDHIVIAAETLEDGVSYVQERLGVDIPFGGKHPLMGTHNHLMQLGNGAFLEVISIDPSAPVGRVRWFGLDEFRGSPRIVHWVVRTDRIDDASQVGVDVGRAVDLTRGALFWKLTVRDDGSMPFDGAFPSVICWPDAHFPVPSMADLGCELEHLVLTHPNAEALKDALTGHLDDERVLVKQGDLKLQAQLRSPLGTFWI